MFITLQSIHDNSLPENRWTELLNGFGNPSDLSIQVSIGDIAKSSGTKNALWAMNHCLPASEWRNIIKCVFPAVKRASAHITEPRVHNHIQTIERWLDGEAVDLRDAANYAGEYLPIRDATYYAAADAASYVARAALGENLADAVNAGRHANAALYFALAGSDAEIAQMAEDIISVYPLHALA